MAEGGNMEGLRTAGGRLWLEFSDGTEAVHDGVEYSLDGEFFEIFKSDFSMIMGIRKDSISQWRYCPNGFAPAKKDEHAA